jgi:hypothetical protein
MRARQYTRANDCSDAGKHSSAAGKLCEIAKDAESEKRTDSRSKPNATEVRQHSNVGHGPKPSVAQTNGP